MSRVGKRPITIPSGVKVAFANNVVNVQGAKGKLDYIVDERFKIEIKDNKVTVSRPSDNRFDMSKHGLIRTLIQNMIIGVTEGFKKELEIKGVGYKAQIQGQKLTMSLGFSHPAVYEVPKGITVQTPKATQIVVSGTDKAKVGEVTAEIREYYLPEPYKGRGIRYVGEYVRHKAGKTVA